MSISIPTFQDAMVKFRLACIEPTDSFSFLLTGFKQPPWLANTSFSLALESFYSARIACTTEIRSFYHRVTWGWTYEWVPSNHPDFCYHEKNHHFQNNPTDGCFFFEIEIHKSKPFYILTNCFSLPKNLQRPVPKV